MVNPEADPEQQSRERPSSLDVVELDGRWVQVLSPAEESLVRFLDDGSVETIDWRDYVLEKRLNTHVALLEQFTGRPLTRIERSKVHLETGAVPSTDEEVDDVHVFGEYRKKTGTDTAPEQA